MKEAHGEPPPQPARPPAGSPPRKRSGLILLLALLVGLIVAALALFRLDVPWDREPGSPPTIASLPTGDVPGTLSDADSETADRDSLGDTRSAPNALPPLPEISLPHEATPGEVDSVSLPALPYSIFHGAYRSPQEAEAIRRELRGHDIPTYIVPVGVQGTVAQALYGVTADGFWYRVLIGHFPTLEDARRFLERLMELRPNDQPQIIRFTYALECSRFLDDRSAEPLLSLLREDEFFPYVQAFPTRDGTHLSRVLVGCSFSRQGAEQLKASLAQRGYPCRIVER